MVNPNGIFSDSEFQELNFLLQNFDNILIDEFDTYSTKIAYWEYCQWTINHDAVINLEETIELSESVMQYKVFDKIWWKYKNPESNTVHYNFADKSKYLEYLILIGEKSEFIEDYAKKLKSTNDLTPSMISEFAHNLKKADLENENIRLIFAIHYLTILNR